MTYVLKNVNLIFKNARAVFVCLFIRETDDISWKMTWLLLTGYKKKIIKIK